MRNLLWKDYLQALSSDDTVGYYTKKYGSIESAGTIVDYHMNIKEKYGLKGVYRLISDINDIPFGQFIAMEKALSSGLDKHEALEILSIYVLRPIKDVIFDNTDVLKESEHVASIMEYDAAEVLYEVERYVEMRDKYVNETYNGVFYIPNRKEDNEEDSEDNDKEELTTDEKFSKTWYWYNIVRALAHEIIWDYERVLMTPMSLVAPELARNRHYQLVEEEHEKRRQMLNKI